MWSNIKKDMVFEKHEREGIPRPDLFPYPDDVIIDKNTGEVTYDGPMSKEQAALFECKGREDEIAPYRHISGKANRNLTNPQANAAVAIKGTLKIR